MGGNNDGASVDRILIGGKVDSENTLRGHQPFHVVNTNVNTLQCIQYLGQSGCAGAKGSIRSWYRLFNYERGRKREREISVSVSCIPDSLMGAAHL